MKMNKNHPHRECLELFSRLSEFLDKELDQELCHSIKQHLSQCEPCRVCVATLERTVALCRKTGEFKVPEEMSRRLREFLARHRPD